MFARPLLALPLLAGCVNLARPLGPIGDGGVEVLIADDAAEDTPDDTAAAFDAALDATDTPADTAADPLATESPSMEVSPPDGPGPVFLCTPDPSALLTDKTIRLPPPPPTLPAVGVPIVDSTFGTTILRVTGPGDGGGCRVAEGTGGGFNRLSRKLIVYCDFGPVIYDFDPVLFRITGKAPPASEPPSENMRWESAVWSAKQPGLVFLNSNMTIWSYDAVGATFTRVKDLESTLGPGFVWDVTRSYDDDVFGMQLRDTMYGPRGFAAWRRSTDTVLHRTDTPNAGFVTLERGGRWLWVDTGLYGPGTVGARVADLVMGGIVDLQDQDPDWPPNGWDAGTGFLFEKGTGMNHVARRALATPHTSTTLLDLGGDYSQDYDLALGPDDEAWGTVAFYASGPGGTGLYRNEIVQVATDGSGTVRRLAHHQSDYIATASYLDIPNVRASRDGCFVAFTSNWGNSGRRDVYVVKVGK